MNYLIACMLSSFAVGIMVGVIAEASYRNSPKSDDDESR
jgi:hypothetical protein